MLSRVSHRRPALLCAIAVTALVALTMAPQAGAEVAGTSDAAADAYKTAIAKAKERRAIKLKKCVSKPTKAKRKACKKVANATFAAAKQQAAEKRDAAGQNDGPAAPAPSSPSEEKDAYRECLQETRDPRQCKEEIR